MSGLLSTSRHLRRHAFDRLALDRDSAYAARELLANDEDAGVRARAARFLGGAPDAIAVPALIDALDDAAPLVRHAAARALAAARVSAAGRAEIHRLAIEDPIWWVRRAAVVTAATRDASAALPTLRAALEDPFWRVRAAAVRALVALGEADDALLERLGPATTDRSSGALGYLARRLGDASRPSGPVAEPPRIPGQPDPDPAVAAARVARGDAVASAFLVECLGDAHASLRAAARKRLTRARDPRALELALLWLDEPRIPHAAETVVELLDGLDRPRADHVLDVAFERGGPGAVCWAASYVGLTRDASREGALLALARAELPIVRSAVIAALGDLGGERARAAIATALSDPAPRVVRIAAHAAFALEMFDELASVDAPADAPTRRVLASLAARRADPDAVDRFSRDPDPRVRAIAVGAMNAAERARFSADPDPWVRAASLGPATATDALARDPHPWVRRAAYRFVRDADPLLAGELASRATDPWLATRACATLDPATPAHLTALLRLSRARAPGVRAAAAERLLGFDALALDAALDGVLGGAPKADAEIRIAAHTLRGRRFEDADVARLRAARASEPEAVRAWIDDALGDDAPRATPPEPGRAPVDVPLRPLGATGLSVAPLVISGAGLLPPRAYEDARAAGCTHFFWEPRYATLERALRRERSAGVVAGTYEASERAIVADVERALRRLRRDAIDVFLLFWVRSPARIDADAFDVLDRLARAGKIRAFGFSTHDRDLACDALRRGDARPWDVVMIRHSAAHPGAEERLLPLARERGVGVLGFSALSYGRVLGAAVSAADAYGYALAQAGISACLSAPRTRAELEENLRVLSAPPLSLARQAELRAHGAIVREESRDFGRSIRRHPVGVLGEDAPEAGVAALGEWLDGEDALDPRFG